MLSICHQVIVLEIHLSSANLPLFSIDFGFVSFRFGFNSFIGLSSSVA
ncbi:hypothetical protein AALP_AA2G169900 [Arabis alpina]|uniref:Uncharacterized protein n=1 Tax=Arabis alpina TaxID=50452 RepID=A0A087HI18_ARAAL|nr:hypothetical protein AALP_AA2G169900 [Arabis alpina]